MAVLEKTKRGLDWLQHGYLLFQILGSGAAGTALKAVLMTYTHLPKVWITPLWLLSSAMVLASLVWVGNRMRKPSSGQGGIAQADSAVSLVTSAKFDAGQFFKFACQSPLTQEAEANMRKAAADNQPNDREGFYAKILGVGIVAYIYDMLWSAIYRSQLLALFELNRRNGMMSLADVRAYYDQAAIISPAYYAHCTFDQWLSFMKEQFLWIVHPSNMVEITVRGRDFLTYLVHFGRESNQRAL